MSNSFGIFLIYKDYSPSRLCVVLNKNFFCASLECMSCCNARMLFFATNLIFPYEISCFTYRQTVFWSQKRNGKCFLDSDVLSWLKYLGWSSTWDVADETWGKDHRRTQWHHFFNVKGYSSIDVIVGLHFFLRTVSFSRTFYFNVVRNNFLDLVMLTLSICSKADKLAAWIHHNVKFVKWEILILPWIEIKK